MNEALKGQVPSYKLCECIPEGMFDNSALVYKVAGGSCRLCLRGESPTTQTSVEKEVPAPLLGEIVPYIMMLSRHPIEFAGKDNGKWSALTQLYKPRGDMVYFEAHSSVDDFLADATLKLLFKQLQEMENV